MCQCSYFHDGLMMFLPSPPRSLVALEVDSEEEAPGPKSLLSRLFSDVGRSEEKKETPHPAPDLTCTRSQSASACEPISKDLSEDGVRLRSYSYSYSKFCPSRNPRDNHTPEGSPDGVLHSVSHSRSLLQALSLSKSTLSLSLLHPGSKYWMHAAAAPHPALL
uniref:PPUP6942 n=1 Tax=Poeciliopsis prolifica TaxID=188132 RepID=A0A0S7EWN3_9TELE